MDREEALRRQFVREARIGVILIGVTLAVFVFVAYSKISGAFTRPMDTGADRSEVSASTLNPRSQKEFTANASFAAIQAATRSMVDKVETQAGNTSPTQAPPMPVPEIQSEDSIRGAMAPQDNSVPSDDSTRQPQSDRPVGLIPSTGNESNADKPIQTIEMDAPKPWALNSMSSMNSNPASNHTLMEPSPFPIRQVAGTESNSILNRPISSQPIDEHGSATPVEADIKLQNSGQRPAQSSIENETVIRLEPGVSLWSLAQRHYGDGRLFRALAAYNGLDPSPSEQVRETIDIRIPAFERLRADYPELCQLSQDVSAKASAVEAADRRGELTYTTREGDTLFRIAREELGQASRYVEIIAINGKLLPSNVTSSTQLQPGIRLRISKE